MARKETASRARKAPRKASDAVETVPKRHSAGVPSADVRPIELRAHSDVQALFHPGIDMPLRLSQTIIPAGTWEIDIQQNKLLWSRELFPLFGIAPSAFSGTFEAYIALIHPDDRARVLEACSLARLKSSGNLLSLEHRVSRDDGSILTVCIQGLIRFDEQGHVISASGIVIDMTGLKALEESHRAMFDQSAVGMGTIAEDGRFIETNRRFQEIVGYTGEELRGMHCREITHPGDYAIEEREEARLLQGEILSSTWDKRYIRKDGRVVWTSLTLSRIAVGRGAPVLSGVVQDITSRKENELELARSKRALQMLSRCNEALIRAESEGTLLDEICEIAASVGGYRMASVLYAQDDAEKSLVPVGEAGANEGYLSGIAVSWDEKRPEGRGAAGKTIRSGQPVVIPDIEADPDYFPWRAAALARGYRSIVALPLTAAGRTFGVFGLYGAEVRPVSADEINLLRELADDMAFGIMGLRAKQEQRRLLSAITTIAEGVSASTGEDFYQQLLVSLTSVLGAHAAVITGLRGDINHIVHAVCAVVDGRLVQDYQYVLHGSPCETLLRQDALVVPRAMLEHYPDAAKMRELKIEAYVGRCLFDNRHRRIGMIYVLFREPLTDVELATSTLKAFAARAAGEMVRQESDSRLREQALMLDRAHDAIIVRTLDHRMVYWNKAAEDLYGWTAEEVLGKNVKDLKVADMAVYEQAMEQLLLHGEWTGEFSERTKSGREIKVECHWTLVQDSAGNPHNVLAINTDVTERRRTESHLQLLEAAVARLNDLVLITEGAPIDEPGPRILYVNDAFVQRTGYAREEVIGRSPRFLQGPETSRAQLDILRCALEKGEATRVEVVNYTRSGEPFWIEIDVVPMFDRTGKITHFVAVERDITERKRAAAQLKESETRLAHVQRLESIGQLTGGIAHDFNNLLTVILGNSDLLVEATKDDPRLRRIATMVDSAGKRGAALTSKLLAFGRLQALEPESVRAGQVIEGMLPLLRGTLGESIRIDALHNDTWMVYIDPTQLESAILNLCINARDAMPEGGHLLIESSNVHLDEKYAEGNAEVSPGEYVMIVITDTGAGIAPENLERVIDPFFTTKPKGKGTGLGLSMVYGFTRQSDGHLKIYSELGAGTSVKLYLPRSLQEAAPIEIPHEEVLDVSGSGRVLLVEDDDLVRSYAQDVLRELGYEVIAAANGQEALNLVQGGVGFDVLFTDVMMPGGMNGPQLAARVRALRPEIPVLYASGYTENAILQQGRADAEANLLHKPYTRRRLSEKLRQTLKVAPPGGSAAS